VRTTRGSLGELGARYRNDVVYDALGQSVPPPGLVRLGTADAGLSAIAAAGNHFTMMIRRPR
jgi:hypothetical protein